MFLLDRRISAVAAEVEAGRPAGADAPMTKESLTLAEQTVYDAAQDLLGMDGVTGPADGWPESWLYSRAASIYGGSAQIQRNVIGERILGLPPEPRPDR
jgi:alkylation response protein AidB-like acyl-CoA dehydrogenase